MKETRKPRRRKRDRQGNRMALIGIVFVIFSMALVVNARSSSFGLMIWNTRCVRRISGCRWKKRRNGRKT